MSNMSTQRGGAPVGYLDEITPVEAGAVVYLRLWFEGAYGQDQVWQDFQKTLGNEGARGALQTLERLCSICAHHGRRPLARHGVNCRCLGGDEACFATFVSYACEGDREDAFLMAANLVRPEMASALVVLAEEFGAVLRKVVGFIEMDKNQTIMQPTHPEIASVH